MTPSPLLSFQARVIKGAGRGKEHGTPTLNLLLTDVPSEMEHGIYACSVALDDSEKLDAVLHYGPRPVFKDSVSCEVHILDQVIATSPASVEVEIAGHLREVRDFPSAEALYEQIAEDISRARLMLDA